jgi:D-tyrosyl-tRNA(Tyr) deacylase
MRQSVPYFPSQHICNIGHLLQRYLWIFEDEQGKMNKSAMEIGSQVLIVSNFTLHGDCRKGRRPGFDLAAEPGEAERLYEMAAQVVREQGVKVEMGRFAADMEVESVNDGPINFLLDSKRLF